MRTVSNLSNSSEIELSDGPSLADAFEGGSPTSSHAATPRFGSVSRQPDVETIAEGEERPGSTGSATPQRRRRRTAQVGGGAGRCCGTLRAGGSYGWVVTSGWMLRWGMWLPWLHESHHYPTALQAGSPGHGGGQRAKPLSLLPLIALIFYDVSGGPFGIEVRQGWVCMWLPGAGYVGVRCYDYEAPMHS